MANPQIRKIVHYFALELTSLQCAKELGINRHTTDRIYEIILASIAYHCEAEQDVLGGEAEPDESYFGGKRKYERGRSVKQKVLLFGLLKRRDKVYTQIILDVSRETLMKIIRKKVDISSIAHTDS